VKASPNIQLGETSTS